MFSRPADYTATLTLPPNVDPGVILEDEDYGLEVRITFRLRGAALAVSLSKRLGAIIVHHIGPYSRNPAGLSCG